jgi:outer membrane protein insertion porin family
VTKFKATYILLIFLLGIFSCRQTKHVPDGKYLVKKNKVIVHGDKLDEDQLKEIIKQQSNFKTLGLKLKLRAFNLVDSAKVAEKRIRKNEKLHLKNDKKLEKQERINTKRIKKAKRKGNELYTRKRIPLKDTLSPKLFLREWLKYKYGEPPVILDSTAFIKTIEQHANYLKKKGYYFGENSGRIYYYPKHPNRKKAKITYELTTGERFYIDSFYVIAENPVLEPNFRSYIKSGYMESLVGMPFDRDLLDDYRTKLAKKFRDESYYGFSQTQISFVADTNSLTKKVILGVKFANRAVRDPSDPEKVNYIRNVSTRVRHVYFHISDTTNFEGNFKDTVAKLGLNLMENQFLQDIDTLLFNEIKKKGTDNINPNRVATFLYNGELFVTPAVIESQNYLEQDNWYKDYYVDRSYTRFVQLGLFQSIKPRLVEIDEKGLIDVHYYLIPAKIQSFGFEPRASNSNGYFGVSASINYMNKNLFGGAQKMKISLTGGFESQPLVFEDNSGGTSIEKIGRGFNTLELGPNVVFDIPGLFPTKLTALSKRHRPRTVMSVAYNFQKREEYTRNTFQANYLWKMYPDKTQNFQFGFPGISVIKFVNIVKAPDFEARINSLNDLFLKNSYSDQLIWQDWKFIFEYYNKDKDNKKTKNQIYYTGSFDPAGNAVSLFKNSQALDTNGRHLLFGVAYAQFLRIDNDFIVSRILNKKSSLHFRALAGGGIPNGNNQTSLPFDYSFFAGGSNDNRGWRARSLGPGSYKYMLDTNRTLTQIGDIRLGASVEYRFSFGPTLKGAAFVDAGNIWTYKEDTERAGSQFSTSFYKEIAYSAGVGLRLDLDFFIIRLDLGVPLNNVSVPKNSRWIWQSRDALNDELVNAYDGIEKLQLLYDQGKIPRPFAPQLHFGIGYPF